MTLNTELPNAFMFLALANDNKTKAMESFLGMTFESTVLDLDMKTESPIEAAVWAVFRLCSEAAGSGNKETIVAQDIMVTLHMLSFFPKRKSFYLSLPIGYSDARGPVDYVWDLLRHLANLGLGNSMESFSQIERVDVVRLLHDGGVTALRTESP